MIDFHVLVDEFLWKLIPEDELPLCKKERLLSLSNDFEDGKWRHSKFQSFIWDNIAETALSFRERKSLADKGYSQLIEAAKKLRLTDASKEQIGQGSELAEIILYGIMKNHYGALPVVPKIFYKQNVQDNAKGADSVHIVVEGGGDFSVWLGEAKFYSSIDDPRLGSIVASVESSLDLEKIKKENSIITNVSDLDELLGAGTELHGKITKLLSKDTSIDLLKPKLHIPILMLYECAITTASTVFDDGFKKRLSDFHLDRCKSLFSIQLRKIRDKIHGYDEIHFHCIIFPVPSKDKAVATFIENVTHYKKQ